MNSQQKFSFRGTGIEALAIVFGASCFGLTSAFSLNNWLNFSIVGVLMVAITASITFLRHGIDLNPNLYNNFLCLSLVILVGLSISLSDNPDTVKMWSHAAARIFSIIFFFAIPGILMDSDRGAIKLLRWGLVGALLLVILLIFYDSLRLNGLIGLEAIPHLGTDDELDALARGSIYRARGGSIEPGHDASVISAILPLLGYWFRKARLLLVISTIFLVIYLIGFSTAFALWYFLFLIFYAYFYGGESVEQRLYSAMRVVFGGAFIYFIYTNIGITTDLYDKFYSISFEDRFFAITDIIEGSKDNFLVLLIGHGPAGYLALNVERVTNTFASFYVDLGLLGLINYALIIAISLRQTLKAADYVYVAGFLAYLFSFVFSIGNYWFPTHWLFLLYPYFASEKRGSNSLRF